MKSIREELRMIFYEQMRKMDEIIDCMEQSVVKAAHKAIDESSIK